MKPIRFILLMMSIVCASAVFAQSPQRFNYQAVARDASGNPISEKQLGVRISILDNTEAGTTLYSETFTPTTTKQGLFSVQVGNGNVASGAFSSIVWGSAPKFLKVEIDPAGGSSYQLLGTSQLLSVPYAFVADRLSAPMSITELSDVSDVVPMTDQILKWDGSNWTPGSGAAVITSSEFLGSGTSSDPLKLAPQGATNGQVLQWNGSIWAPATISGGVGDNWGTQSVVTGLALQGAGTAASPLTIAQQAASNGQVLKWNGTAWAPGNDTGVGDNWGTAKVNTSTQFAGDGTPGNPLKLGANGASSGQVLKFDGVNWVPGDGSGALTLPASGNISDAGVALQVQNNTGTGIVGIQGGNTNNNYAVKGLVVSNTGAATAGVFGQHGSSGFNGFGVQGLHNGSGSGVYGESTGAGIGVNGKAGSNGIGVYGSGLGSTGYGVVGLGNTGVSGTSNTAAGSGVYGNATAGGYAGWFDARTLIRSNSTATEPNLYIWENDMNDKARIMFNNGIANESWTLSGRTTSSAGTDVDKFAVNHFSGGDILTVQGDKKVGINVQTPELELDVNGSIKLTGSLKANGTVGTNGQVLTSMGNIAMWTTPNNGLYNNTYLYDQNAEVNITNNSNTISGLNNMSINLAGPAKVMFNFSHAQITNTGGFDVEVQITMAFTGATGSPVINQTVIKEWIEAGKTRSISYTHHCQFNSAGQILPFIGVATTGSIKIAGPSGVTSTGQVSIQIIHQ